MVPNIENAASNPQKVTKWIKDISDLHRTNPPPNVLYSKTMPDMEVSTLSPFNPQPSTPHPKPRTLNPEPQTSSPKPQTPNPKPQTPNPKPQTSNPEPQAWQPAASPAA